jgi:hypothetical protein
VLQDFQRLFIQTGRPVPKMLPVPVYDIAAQLSGLDLEAVEDLAVNGQRLSGLLDAALRLISYEVNELAARQVFSVAHELGHYYLHYLPSRPAANQATLFQLEEPDQSRSYYRCVPTDIDTGSMRDKMSDKRVRFEDLATTLGPEQQRLRRETEANRFAAALLMPTPILRDLMQKGYTTPPGLASQLGVSPLAAEVRLVQLGYRQYLERDRRPGSPKQDRLL